MEARAAGSSFLCSSSSSSSSSSSFAFAGHIQQAEEVALGKWQVASGERQKAAGQQAKGELRRSMWRAEWPK